MAPRRSIQRMNLVVADDWQDYALLDSGYGQKHERFGPYQFVRPDTQALWPPHTLPEHWRADAVFDSNNEQEDAGRWQFKKRVPESWPMTWHSPLGDVRFLARCTPFRHLGVFPEHSTHWRWCQERVADLGALMPDHMPKVLNLFGYTGMASLACATAGAHVTHVDASKKSVTFARDNAYVAGLAERPIRWLVEDAFKFVSRELRRGSQYDGIILDPPKHGRGPNGEIWKLEEGLQDLLGACVGLLSGPKPFIVSTVYAVRLSLLSLENCLDSALAMRDDKAFHGGVLESGEMALKEASGRLLPTAIYARWHG